MPLYRKLLIIALILTGLYAILGFLIVPPLVRHFGEKALKEQVGEASVITKVRVNPFLWSLEVEGLELIEPSEAWSVTVNRALVDLSARSVLKFYPVLDMIELDSPAVTVVRSAGETSVEAPEPEGLAAVDWREQIAELNTLEIPKIRIDQLEVLDGSLDFRDETTETPYRQKVESVTFSLSDFTTVVDSENAMQFKAVTEMGASIRWEGIVTSQPITSSGSVEIAVLKLDHLSPYYEHYLLFDLKSAIFGMSFDYVLDLSQPENLFQLSEGFVGLSEVLCVPTQVDDRILSIQSIGLDSLSFSFPSMEVAATRFAVEDGETRIERSAEGEFNLMGLIALPEGGAPSGPAAISGSTMSALSYALDLVEVTDYQVIWVDNLETGSARLEVGIPSAKVEGISSDLEKPLQLSAEYTFGETGGASVSGTVIPASRKVDIAVVVESLPLSLGLPYSQEFARMDIEDGLLHFKGGVKSSQPGVFALNGSGSVDTFSASKGGDSPMEVGFESFRWANLQAVTEPLSVKMDSIVLEKPVGAITRLLLAEAEAAETDHTAASASQEVADAPADAAALLLEIWIGSIEVTGGSFALKDESLELHTTTEIADMNLLVKDFATMRETPSSLEASSTVNGAPFEMNGSFYLGDLKKESAFKLKLSDLPLPTFSSYSGQAVGRRIAKGRFALESDWTIVGAKLKAENQILIEQIELGDSVESDTAVRLPLDLAITLLKDTNGAIDVQLPLSGDLSDPKASVGQIVVKACIGLITNVAAAPFKLLSGLAGSDKDLSKVSFAPGDAFLSDDTLDSINALATALKERPQLKLKMIPLLGEEDLEAFRLAQVRAMFMDGVEEDDTAKFLKNLEQAYIAKMKASGAAPEAYVTKDNPEAEALWMAAFLPDVIVAETDTMALAKARAEAVKSHFVTSHAVAPERLVVVDSEMSEAGETGLRFDLE
ncbi:MAG: DUF748 domain-containing protein [Verrucomicrobiota bacterium]